MRKISTRQWDKLIARKSHGIRYPPHKWEKPSKTTLTNEFELINLGFWGNLKSGFWGYRWERKYKKYSPEKLNDTLEKISKIKGCFIDGVYVVVNVTRFENKIRVLLWQGGTIVGMSIEGDKVSRAFRAVGGEQHFFYHWPYRHGLLILIKPSEAGL